MMEAAFGLGLIFGPSLGSFVYGAVGYQMTMYYFACQTLLFMAINWQLVPSSLNYDGNQD